MIYTVTFNPSVDYVVRLEALELGGLNRTSDTAKYAGGKGINVSRILSALDVPSTALGFAGGFTGDFIKDTLENQGIQSDFISVNGDTRINVKLKTGEETEINASGPSITDADISRLKAQLSNMTSEDHVVFAGSVPSGYDHLYETLAKLLHDRKIEFTIDAEGTKLTSTLQYAPYLIKPNQFELEGITGRSLFTTSEMVDAARSLLDRGAKNILLTLGKDGALFISHDHEYFIPSPAGALKNSVGAGDSTVAGFISRKDGSISEQLKYAIACGSATAFSDDLATREDIEALLDKIEVQSIEEVK
ncbi:1-phosphofructokinase [Salinicoccus hispanicus]|uniref:Tagatose-6-phosphate kinase n=1 Tax=Salinicoccus hispanicus TaxID=157225 RepID=A0A6N8TWL8_9STAP|nr:1-phosphofructokinase [Salinicoccus hispanicus]MXQ50093.1 1-phosphofructokinase [Salinicoccus hispanicus]